MLGQEDLHVDADLGDQVLGAVPLNSPGIEQSRSIAASKGAICSPIASVGASICSVEEVQVGEDRPDQQRVQLVETPFEGSSPGIFLCIRAIAGSGSVVPGTSVSSIARRRADSRRPED